MVAFNKFQQFIGDLGLKVHNLNTDALKIYLSNTAPDVVNNKIKADLAEIATGNGYAGPVGITNAYSQSGGTGTLTSAASETITASGGTIGPFRYVVLYNDTPTSPNKPLIGYWDYGSATTLQNGENVQVTFGANVLTLA